MTKLATAVTLFTLALVVEGCASQPGFTPTLTPTSQPRPTPTHSFAAPSPTPTSRPTPSPTSTVRPAVGGRTATFEIIPGETTARYQVNQVLLSEDNRLATVAGQTGGVEGVFALNADSHIRRLRPLDLSIQCEQSLVLDMSQEFFYHDGQ